VKTTMKVSKVVVIQFGISAMILGLSFPEEPKTTTMARKPVVVWVAKETTCPLTNGRPNGEIEDPDLNIFTTDDEATEPRFDSHFGDFDWKRHFDCFKQHVGVSVYQLVINRAGHVEEITRLVEEPDCWTAAMVDFIRSWEIAPATVKGEPVCVAFVVSFHMHPY